MSRFCCTFILACLLTPPPALGQLTAQECVLIFNSRSKNSRDLAHHYAEVRGIPPEHLLGLDLPFGERMPRGQYDSFAENVRTFLEGLPDSEKVRCLVTFHDVPLHVNARRPSEDDLKTADRLRSVQAEDLERFHRILDECDPAGAAIGKSPTASQDPNENRAAELLELMNRYSRTRGRLAAELDRLTDKEQEEGFTRLLKVIEQVEGRKAAVAALQSARARNPQMSAERIAALADQAQKIDQRLSAVRDEGPWSPQYEATVSVVSVWYGLAGVCTWLEADIGWLTGEECHAALDSELSLLLWGRYNPYRWQPNTLNPKVKTTIPVDRSRRVLMVSRIDAPTPEVARRMIDDAVAVEATGLTGTVYIDKRAAKSNGQYADYDGDLFELFRWIQGNTDMPAVLDSGPQVFPEGSCPNAALYCGWYSLAKYVPAFDFVRGAVGFHIASFELRSLRREDRTYWCPGLLKDGICATLGPTAEPYLTAFPRPTRFFGFLMTGELTLVECFYQSKPCNSWQTALLSDPLYRPFAKNPKLKLEDVDSLSSTVNGSP